MISAVILGLWPEDPAIRERSGKQLDGAS